MNFDLLKHTILLNICGSRAYGTNTESSDLDFKGICIPPKEYFFGAVSKFEQAEFKNSSPNIYYNYFNEEERKLIDKQDSEGTVYDIRKFIKLATDANPNILDTLYCREQDIKYQNKFGKKIRDNRDLFLTKRIAFTFSGFAAAQLKRIKLHRDWLLNPMTHKPERSDYGLADNTFIPKEQLEATNDMIKKKIDSWEIDFGELNSASKQFIQDQLVSYMTDLEIYSEEDKYVVAARSLGFNDNFIEHLITERKYLCDVRKYAQYMEWKKNRNPERAEMEAKFGFDSKHALHLYRLFRMCSEGLKTGCINVYRDDAEELKEIKNGKLTFEQILEFAEQQDKEMKILYEQSKLPKSPNVHKIEQLCVEIIEEFLEEMK